MEFLDAALRCAEKRMANSKDQDLHADFSGEQGLEPHTDDLGVSIKRCSPHHISYLRNRILIFYLMYIFIHTFWSF